MALSAGLYFHPLDLPHYLTTWDLSPYEEAIVTVPVVAATSVGVDEVYVLNAVWAPTRADMLSGDWIILANAAFDGTGFHSGGWQAIDVDARAEVCVGMVLDVQAPVDNLALGQVVLRTRAASADAPACAPADVVAFSLASPGRLTVDAGFYGDYQIAPDNFGYTEAEARAVVAGALENGAGWQRAGITFRETVGAPITFRFVEGPIDCGGVTAVGCTSDTGGGTALVEISYQRASAGYGRNLVNHESGHAYFGATHTGGGIMAGASFNGWPTRCDVQSVIDWLGA